MILWIIIAAMIWLIEPSKAAEDVFDIDGKWTMISGDCRANNIVFTIYAWDSVPFSDIVSRPIEAEARISNWCHEYYLTLKLFLHGQDHVIDFEFSRTSQPNTGLIEHERGILTGDHNHKTAIVYMDNESLDNKQMLTKEQFDFYRE